ncbi:MAG: c-type cytochrome biogenesis protein CcsB, partial [Acidothermaceae bacterium]
MPVDVGLAKLSNDLIAGGIVAYALGFLGFAVDAAFGNHAPASRGFRRTSSGAASAAVAAKVPAMAGASAGAASTNAGTNAGTNASARADAEVAFGASPTAGDLRLGGSAGGPGAPGSSPSGQAGSHNAWLMRRVGAAALVCTIIGWLLEGGSIVSRGLAVHRLPWGNMYEFTLALTFASVTAFLVILSRQPVRYLGVFLMAPVVLALGLAVLVLYVPPAPLMPALHSYWLAIHVTAAIIASGVFMVGTAATMMFLVADRYAVASAAGKPVRFAALARMMPDPETLDRTAYRTFAFAFPIWTFAVIAGAIWAEYAWGHYWQWDPKETWAFITWIVYAGYLHARATAGWR